LTIQKNRKIHFHTNLCRGCGVCSTACPEEAIAMIPLDTCNERQSLITRIGCGPAPASAINDS
jgi:MinD superfamily P-loop ATPase